MEQPWDPEEEVPTVARRDQAVHPPWFVDPDEQARRFEAARAAEANDAVPPRFSGWRVVGALVVGLTLVGVPVNFIIDYRSTPVEARPLLTAGFYVALALEALAVWGLIRLLTRR